MLKELNVGDVLAYDVVDVKYRLLVIKVFKNLFKYSVINSTTHDPSVKYTHHGELYGWHKVIINCPEYLKK